MDIKYLSSEDAAIFGEMIHSESELAELFGKTILLLDTDTDYEGVMVSFESEDTMRVSVDASPYLIILDAQSQTIILQQSHEDIFEDDFGEDGVESVVDMIASRILTEEYTYG